MNDIKITPLDGTTKVSQKSNPYPVPSVDGVRVVSATTKQIHGVAKADKDRVVVQAVGFVK